MTAIPACSLWHDACVLPLPFAGQVIPDSSNNNDGPRAVKELTMRWFLSSAAVVVLTLAVSEAVQASGHVVARPGRVGVGRTNVVVAPVGVVNTGVVVKTNTAVVVNNYHLTHGIKCSYGYCYKGFNHCHWSYRCWNARCGCCCYFDPCTNCLYYWCVPDNCYYPITYCPYGVYTF